MFLFTLLLLLPVSLAAEDEQDFVQIGSAKFWSQIVAIICLVLLSGVVAGLTLGLMSLDTTNLKILELAGNKKQQYYASRILPIRKNGHILLTTLLLTNTVLNETLPILFDDIFRKGFMSVIVSTILLVLFSEIIPQAVFTKHGLAIGSLFAFPVKVLIFLWFIIAWPISKFLDLILGPHEGFHYTEPELGALVQLHDTEINNNGCLNNSTVKMLQNILKLQDKTIGQMSSLTNFLLVSSDVIIDQNLIEEYAHQKYTHLVVHEPEDDENILGVLELKNLSLEESLLKPIGQIKLEPFVKFNSSTSILQIIQCMTENEQTIIVYQTEQEVELAKQKQHIQIPFHKRVFSCRVKKFCGYLCHACSEQSEEEKTIGSSISSTTVSVGIVDIVTCRDILSHIIKK